jgi:hypothetical protein
MKRRKKMITNPYLRKLMRTPFVGFYACDENGNHLKVTHNECFKFPIHKDQRWAWWFDETDPKNASNIIVRMPLTAHGKKIGNRCGADRKADIRKPEAENEFTFISIDGAFNVTDGVDKPIYLEPVALDANPYEIFEAYERRQLIAETLKKVLPNDYLQLAFDTLVFKKTERELAPKYGCSPRTIGNRKRKIIEILQTSELLKNFHDSF